MWYEVTARLFSRIETKTGMKLAPLIYEHLGVCHDSKQIRPGLLASSPEVQLKEAVIKLLRETSFSYEESIITVNQVTISTLVVVIIVVFGP